MASRSVPREIRRRHSSGLEATKRASPRCKNLQHTEREPLTTYRLCDTCKNVAVIGQAHCPKHGGVVPKTIKEYEELRDSNYGYVQPIQTPFWTSEPKPDRLSELRDQVEKWRDRDIDSLSWEDGELTYDHGHEDGAIRAYTEVLLLIESMSRNL